MTQPAIPIAVIMERREIESRWVTHAWRAIGVELDGVEGDILETVGGSHFQHHAGFEIRLFRDEAEGYFLNVETGEPKVFVMWRQEEGEAEPTPHSVTASYNEAARWMDAQEKVDAVPMPGSMARWLAEYVADNYKPEPKKKRVKASFLAPRDKAQL
jgi:hypothetical protein